MTSRLTLVLALFCACAIVGPAFGTVARLTSGARQAVEEVLLERGYVILKLDGSNVDLDKMNTDPKTTETILPLLEADLTNGAPKGRYVFTSTTANAIGLMTAWIPNALDVRTKMNLASTFGADSFRDDFVAVCAWTLAETPAELESSLNYFDIE